MIWIDLVVFMVLVQYAPGHTATRGIESPQALSPHETPRCTELGEQGSVARRCLRSPGRCFCRALQAWLRAPAAGARVASLESGAHARSQRMRQI